MEIEPLALFFLVFISFLLGSLYVTFLEDEK